MREHGNILSVPHGQGPSKYRNSVTSMPENGIMVQMAWPGHLQLSHWRRASWRVEYGFPHGVVTCKYSAMKMS